MTYLTRWVLIWMRRERKCKGHVVRSDVKLASLQKIAKMLYSKIDGGQLSIKCAVPSLSILRRLREEWNWTPSTIVTLLKNSTNCNVGCVSHQNGRGIWKKNWLKLEPSGCWKVSAEEITHGEMNYCWPNWVCRQEGCIHHNSLRSRVPRHQWAVGASSARKQWYAW